MKNSNQKLWFKAKHYGWGWYPATWEGVLVTVLYVLLVLGGELVFINDLRQNLPRVLSWLFVTYVFILTALLLAICYKKGEEPRWRWGNKK